ncbi:hypothetical protein G7Y79_00010g027850 [Physcia stellaris]|nr:hypothetical protein G7Y79_00010g027850 [Physcia stellaris]
MPSLGNSVSPNDYTAVYIPPPNVCGILCQHYFLAVNPMIYLLDENQFNATVIQYFQNPSSASHSTRALISAVCFAAAVSMPFLLVQQKLSIAKKVLVERLKHATEQSLQTVDLLNSVSLEVMQAAVIYLLPLCRNEVSETSSMLVQKLLRNAQLAGFNSDCISSSTSDPSEFDAKRHLWNELCVLALRTSSPRTPNPSLLPPPPPTPPPSSHPLHPPWTDSTFSHLRHACYALHQQILSSDTDPSRLAHTLRAQRKHLEAHYLHALDPSLPLHRYARVVATLLIAGADFVLFYPLYAAGSGSGDEDRDKRASYRVRAASLLRSSLDVLESAAALETDPGFAAWGWCAGSYQSYTYMLYLLVMIVEVAEGVGGGMLEEGVDYIFGDSVGIPLAQRSRQVLAAVGEGMRRFVQVKEVGRVDSRMEVVAVEEGVAWEGAGAGAEVEGEGAGEREREREEEDGRESLFVSEMAFGAALAEMNWEGGTGWG